MKAKLQKIALIPLFLIITIFTSCQSTKNEIPLPQISLQNGTLENGMKYYFNSNFNPYCRKHLFLSLQTKKEGQPLYRLPLCWKV